MFTEQQRKIVTVALIAIAAAGTIVGYFVLPATIAVQITAGGQVGNTMPKLVGLAIPAVITVIGAILFYKNGAEGNTRHNGLLISGVGLLVFVLLFVFNL